MPLVLTFSFGRDCLRGCCFCLRKRISGAAFVASLSAKQLFCPYSGGMLHTQTNVNRIPRDRSCKVLMFYNYRHMTSQSVRRSSRISWSVLFFLWAIQGAFFFWQFATLPSDAEGGILFGYSVFRLAGIVFLFAWILATSTLAFISKRNAKLKERLDSIFTSSAGDVLLIASLVILLAGQATLAVLWGLSQHRAIFSYVAYATRLAPLLNLASLVALEFIGWMVYRRWQSFQPMKDSGRDLLRRAAIVWSILGALAILIAATGLGIVPDKTGEWSLPGVPLLEWQILLACVTCVLVLFLEVRINLNSFKHPDLWISIALWLGILLYWISQPVNPGFTALAPRAPNYEIYPFTDGQVYDEFAQSLLIGNGLKGNEIPPRPLYIVFLAFLHLIAGQDYTSVINAQLVFLAFFPVALYWVGREMYGRPVGIAIALLAGLREYTSNIAAPFTNALSYSKLYLSEVPVAIFLVLFTFLAVRWVRASHPNHLAVVAGGVLGIGIMIRTQAVVALPVLLVIAYLADRKRMYPILRGALLMTVAVVLVISPWLWRNWKNTGQLIFDSPFTQTINLAQRYSRMNGVEADAIRRPGETNIEYNDRLIGIFKDAVTQNPREAVRVVINRFLNNCVDNVLLLPLRNDLTNIGELFQPDRAFWEEWQGRPTPSQTLLLVFYLFLLGLGLAAAWKRLGLLGLLPLFINLVYNFWTSLALLGGQRFKVAMDWSIYMYYMNGMFVLISAFLFLMETTRASVLTWVGSRQKGLVQPSAESKPRPWTHYLLAGAFFLFIGVSVPLSEKVFPKKYPPLTQEQLFDEFTSSTAFRNSGVDPACIAEVISNNGLTAARGRALSPRYYESGEGEYTDKFGYKPSEQPRLLFYMTGDYYGVVLLERNEVTAFLPHASDVIVYRDRDIPQKAWFVLVSDDGREGLYFSDTVNNPCNTNP
ncbi:MAG: hypothetical protein FIB03_00530 [Anaerolineae bacterium]|nr:hypothetical protein [Anaerolineae bacterium]